MLPDDTRLPISSLSFRRDEELGDVSRRSPLAARLLALDGVCEVRRANCSLPGKTTQVRSEARLPQVMLTATGIAVNVTDPGHWETAKPLISETISSALKTAAEPDGEAVVTARGSVQAAAAETVWEAGSVEAAVDEVLQAHIRPYVLDDGGDIRLARANVAPLPPSAARRVVLTRVTVTGGRGRGGGRGAGASDGRVLGLPLVDRHAARQGGANAQALCARGAARGGGARTMLLLA